MGRLGSSHICGCNGSVGSVGSVSEGLFRQVSWHPLGCWKTRFLFPPIHPLLAIHGCCPGHVTPLCFPPSSSLWISALLRCLFLLGPGHPSSPPGSDGWILRPFFPPVYRQGSWVRGTRSKGSVRPNYKGEVGSGKGGRWKGRIGRGRGWRRWERRWRRKRCLGGGCAAGGERGRIA